MFTFVPVWGGFSGTVDGSKMSGTIGLGSSWSATHH
jgi:hypothetical protein